MKINDYSILVCVRSMRTVRLAFGIFLLCSQSLVLSLSVEPIEYTALNWFERFVSSQRAPKEVQSVRSSFLGNSHQVQARNQLSPIAHKGHWCQQYRELPNAGLPYLAKPLVVYCLNSIGQIEAVISPKNNTSFLISPDDSQLHRRIIRQLLAWIPPDQRGWLRAVVMMHSPINGAYSAPINNNRLHFMMAIDVNDAAAHLSRELVIHEWMHILSWRSEQGAGKPYLEPPYRRAFAAQFWPKGQFYKGDQNTNNYVSEYAMQSMDEDLAESFAAYVTESKDFRVKSEKTRQKMNFFNGFPVLYNYKQWFQSTIDVTAG